MEPSGPVAANPQPLVYHRLSPPAHLADRERVGGSIANVANLDRLVARQHTRGGSETRLAAPAQRRRVRLARGRIRAHRPHDAEVVCQVADVARSGLVFLFGAGWTQKQRDLHVRDGGLDMARIASHRAEEALRAGSVAGVALLDVGEDAPGCQPRYRVMKPFSGAATPAGNRPCAPW